MHIPILYLGGQWPRQGGINSRGRRRGRQFRYNSWETIGPDQGGLITKARDDNGDSENASGEILAPTRGA